MVEIKPRSSSGEWFALAVFISMFVAGAAMVILLPLTRIVPTGAQSRAYGAPLAYDETTPLPIPPLAYFAVGLEQEADLLARVAAYCSDVERLPAWFDDENPARLKALCGMYIVATNAPYHEQPAPPTDALAFARQVAQHCGTVPVAQGRIYTALGLDWRLREAAGHGWVEVRVDGTWEIFDATVNVWYRDKQARRAFWLPDYPGALDHTRYGYDVHRLRRAVFDGDYHRG